MVNKSPTISANEINKYCYCNYQWYYQRKFGSKKLYELRKENIGDNYDKTLTNFKNGNQFHSDFHFSYKLKRKIFILVSVLLSLLLLFMWAMMYV